MFCDALSRQRLHDGWTTITALVDVANDDGERGQSGEECVFVTRRWSNEKHNESVRKVSVGLICPSQCSCIGSGALLIFRRFTAKPDAILLVCWVHGKTASSSASVALGAALQKVDTPPLAAGAHLSGESAMWSCDALRDVFRCTSCQQNMIIFHGFVLFADDLFVVWCNNFSHCSIRSLSDVWMSLHGPVFLDVLPRPF